MKTPLNHWSTFLHIFQVKNMWFLYVLRKVKSHWILHLIWMQIYVEGNIWWLYIQQGSLNSFWLGIVPISIRKPTRISSWNNYCLLLWDMSSVNWQRLRWTLSVSPSCILHFWLKPLRSCTYRHVLSVWWWSVWAEVCILYSCSKWFVSNKFFWN